MTTPFTTPSNFRDLGGLPLASGSVREGLVFRSDDITTADEAFLARMKDEHGIRQVLDLRAGEETGDVQLSRLTGHGFDYHNVTLGGQVMVGFNLPSNDDEMSDFYVRLVEQHAPQFVSTLSLIAWSPGPIVFHCAGGKDRTGMLAAFLLLILGANDQVILDDFERTRDSLPGMIQRWLAVASDEPNERLPDRQFLLGLNADNLPAIMDARRSVMEMALDKLTRQFGDPLFPLERAGLDEFLKGRLREHLIA